jgi:YggT family protein
VGAPIYYLFNSLIDIFTIGVLLNFLFRLLKVDYYNPLVKGIIKAVDFPSKILRSFIKPIYSLDLSSFLIALFVQAGSFYLIYSIQGTLDNKHLTILILSFYSVILLILNMAFFIMLGGIILSWVARDNFHPAIILIRQMSDKFFKPFRTFLPPMGGLDFSPILAFIVLTFFRDIFIDFAKASGL